MANYRNQSSPDGPRKKARRRLTMVPNPETVLLAAVVVGEVAA